jgi:hypothetical protein
MPYSPEHMPCVRKYSVSAPFHLLSCTGNLIAASGFWPGILQHEQQQQEEDEDAFVDEEWLNQQNELEAMGLPTCFGGAHGGGRGGRPNGGRAAGAVRQVTTRTASTTLPSAETEVGGDGGFWQQAYDRCTSSCYYYNEVLQVTQWEPPPHFVPVRRCHLVTLACVSYHRPVHLGPDLNALQAAEPMEH